MSERILAVSDVTKRFGGLVALDNVTLHVDRGEIVGLIGPNGAGKTTLFNVVAGAYHATAGTVTYLTHNITQMTPNKRCHLGIGRTFQITKPFGGMTVLENVCAGALFGKSAHINLLSQSLKEQCMAEAEQILRQMDLYAKQGVKASTLNVPERKRLEICRALATQPQLLLLDEVVAGLNPSEVGDMVELIRQVNEQGVTILMIEHVMKAVMRLSHRMYVLNFGKLIAEGTPEQIAADPTVISAYLGKIGQKEAVQC